MQIVIVCWNIPYFLLQWKTITGVLGDRDYVTVWSVKTTDDIYSYLRGGYKENNKNFIYDQSLKKITKSMQLVGVVHSMVMPNFIA